MKGYSPSAELINLYDTAREKPFEFMHSRSFVNINVATGWTVSQGGQFPYENVITLPVDEGDFPITMEYQPTAIIQPNANESCAPSNFPYIETTGRNRVTLYAYSIPSPTSMLPIVINLTQNGSPYGSTNASAQRSTVEQTMIQLSQNYFLVEVNNEVLTKDTTITFDVTAYKGGERISITPPADQPEYAITNQDGNPILNPDGTYPSVVVKAVTEDGDGDESEDNKSYKVTVTINLLKDTIIKNGIAIIQFPVQASGVFYPRATINAITSTAILEQVDSYDLNFGTLTRSSDESFFVDGKALSETNKWIIKPTKRTLNGVVSSVSGGKIIFTDVEKGTSHSKSLSSGKVELEEELNTHSVFKANRLRIDLEIGGKVVGSKSINIIVSAFSTLIQPSVEYIVSGSTNNIRFSSYTLLEGGIIIPKYGTLTIYKNSVSEANKLISKDNVNEINYSLTESGRLQGVRSFIATFAETIGGEVTQQRVIPVVSGTEEPDIFGLVASPVVLMVDVDKNYELKSNPVSTLKVFRNGNDVTGDFTFAAVSDGGEDFTFVLDNVQNKLTVTEFGSGASQIVGVTITATNNNNPNIKAIGSLQAIRQVEEEIISYYTYIRYTSNVTDGTDITEDIVADTKYMGVVITTTAVAPTNKAEYKWTPVAEDGRGIKSTDVYYAVTGSETERPEPESSLWGDFPTPLIKGEYLWTKTKTTYTDDTFTYAYNVSYIAIDGLKFYTWIMYSDSLDDEEDLYDTPTANTLYIGIATNKDDSTPSKVKGDYVWSKFKGEDGYTPIKGIDYFDGAAGINARAVSLTTPTQAFTYTAAGISPSPSGSVTITATAYNTIGTVYYEFLKNGVSDKNTTSNTYSYTPQASFANMPDLITVKIREGFLDSAVLATDTLSMIGVKPGTDGKNGTDGINGSRTAILEMYQWKATAPILFPKGTSTYSWASGTFSAPSTPNSWTLLPATGVAGQTLWTCRTVFSDNLTTTNSTVTWNANTAYPVGAYGANGEDGSNGTRTALIELYKWSATAPATYPSGSSTYTWSDGTFTNPTTLNGWSQTISAPVLGQTLYGISQSYSDTNTSATSTITWTSTTPYPIGYSGKNGADGDDGVSPIIGYLTNESHVVSANTSGDGYSLTSAGGTFKVYEGVNDRTTSSSFSGTATKNGLTLSIDKLTGIYTLTSLTGSSWTTDSEFFDLSAEYNGVTITKRFVISKSKAGVKGDIGPKGDNAPLVKLSGATQIITQSNIGVRTPSASFTVVGTSVNTTISAWTYSVNGGTFGTGLTTGVTRSGNTVTINPSTITFNTLSIKATGGGVSDTFTIARIVDGDKGADAYTVLLSNESHTFAGSTTSALAGSTTSSVIAYKGTTRITATINSITGQPTGMITSISNNETESYFTVEVDSELVTPSGVLTVNLTVDGKTFTRTFSFAVSYKGDRGPAGPVLRIEAPDGLAFNASASKGLRLNVKLMDEDINRIDEYDPEEIRWERSSSDSTGDILFASTKQGSSIYIDPEFLNVPATYTCFVSKIVRGDSLTINGEVLIGEVLTNDQSEVISEAISVDTYSPVVYTAHVTTSLETSEEIKKIEKTLENIEKNSVTTSDFERTQNRIFGSVAEVITTTADLVTRVNGVKDEVQKQVLKQEALTSELDMTSRRIRGEVRALSTTGDQRHAALELKADSIESEVRKMGNDLSYLSSQVTQEADNITTTITSLSQGLGASKDDIDKIQTYFRIDGDGVILGKSNNPIEFYAEPDEVGFRENGKRIAYWKEGTMNVDNLIAILTIIIGHHQIEKYNSLLVGKTTVIRRGV